MEDGQDMELAIKSSLEWLQSIVSGASEMDRDLPGSTESSQSSESVDACTTPISPTLPLSPIFPSEATPYHQKASWLSQGPPIPLAYGNFDPTQAPISDWNHIAYYYDPTPSIFTQDMINSYEMGLDRNSPIGVPMMAPALAVAQNPPPMSPSGNHLVHRQARASLTHRSVPYSSMRSGSSPQASSIRGEAFGPRRPKVYLGDSQEDGPVRHHTCQDCKQMFIRKEHLNRHVRTVHQKAKIHKCPTCGKCCSRSDNLKQHMLVHAKSSQDVPQFTEVQLDTTH